MGSCAISGCFLAVYWWATRSFFYIRFPKNGTKCEVKPDLSYVSCPDGPQRVLPCSALIEMYEEAELVHAALMLVCTSLCSPEINMLLFCNRWPTLVATCHLILVLKMKYVIFSVHLNKQHSLPRSVFTFLPIFNRRSSFYCGNSFMGAFHWEIAQGLL